MKDILTAPFVEEMKRTTANMYRMGWDERNGGNISYLLEEDEVAEYLDLNQVIRTIPTGFDATDLIGKIFIVTGTGKYFKNVEGDPETNLGIIRIAQDGTTAQLLWGYKDGGKFTSELPAHLMSHMARLKVDPLNRVVMHCHPTYTLAMNFVHELDEKKFTHTLWEMCTECIVVFPDGVGVLPWMLCGTNSIGEATAMAIGDLLLTPATLAAKETMMLLPPPEQTRTQEKHIPAQITVSGESRDKHPVMFKVSPQDLSTAPPRTINLPLKQLTRSANGL